MTIDQKAKEYATNEISKRRLNDTYDEFTNVDNLQQGHTAGYNEAIKDYDGISPEQVKSMREALISVMRLRALIEYYGSNSSVENISESEAIDTMLRLCDNALNSAPKEK